MYIVSEFSQKMHNPKISPALESTLNEYEEAKKKGTLVLRDLKEIMQDLKIEEKELKVEVC